MKSRLQLYVKYVYFISVKTVVETEQFIKHSAQEWTDDERLDFIAWIAENPESGVVIPGTGGVRKVRWAVRGSGKRGGVRVIYYNVDAELLLLIDMYKKNRKASMGVNEIRRIK